MSFYRPKFPARAARWLCATLLLTVCCHVLRAQTEPQPERWLLVFDTSSTMKKYLPATSTAVRQFLDTSANGQLQKHASVGVWSYGSRVNEKFKTYTWEPESADAIATNLLAYLHQQHYSGDSTLSALQLLLSRIIAGSERLTLAIFCDGQSPINFTPYDDGVNQSFHDGLDEREKSRQPFVVIVRSQLGKFVGCTVSYPPASLNLPDFPPLPASLTNTPPPRPEPKVIPKAEPPPLIIVGTKVGTNLNSLKQTALPQPKPDVGVPTNPSKPTFVPPGTNSPVRPTTNAANIARPAQTNVAVIPASPEADHSQVATQTTATVAVAPVNTNAVPVAGSEKRDQLTGVLIVIGVGLLLVAVVLVGFLVRSGRRPRSSLITSSMQDPPPRK